MNIAKGATWKKASRSSGGSSNCVELADLGVRGLAVRDSKNTGGGVLAVGQGARRAFFAAAKADRISG